MPNLHFTGRPALLASACIIATLSAGCSSLSSLTSGEKIDYRSSGAKTVTLEVPPDLTQLSGQGRYTPANTGGVVTASGFNQQVQQATAPQQGAAVAARAVGGVQLEREGQVRWLSVDLPPEQVWSAVRDFWVENGFELTVDQPQAGVMETNWSENRAKLAQDGLRQLMGRLLDNLYDTGERDLFRTRIERTARGSEIYISHRGLQELFTDARKESTHWKARPADAALEAEMLSRLMVKLGTPKDAAQAAVARSASALTPRARLQADGLTVAMTGDFDQTWRRVGLALDRGGFTVEDRDRTKGVYDVRLAASATQAKTGLVDRMFGWMGRKAEADTLTRYRLQVASQGGNATVTVLDNTGKPATTEGGKEVARLLSANLE